MALISSDNILFDSQIQICDILKQSSSLSNVTFIPENSKDVEFQITNALKRQGLACVVMTPNAEYIGNNDQKENVLQLDIQVLCTENVLVNRATPNSMTGQDVAMKVIDELGSKKFGMFSPRNYRQYEENSLLVSEATLQCYITP